MPPFSVSFSAKTWAQPGVGVDAAREETWAVCGGGGGGGARCERVL